MNLGNFVGNTGDKFSAGHTQASMNQSLRDCRQPSWSHEESQPKGEANFTEHRKKWKETSTSMTLLNNCYKPYLKSIFSWVFKLNELTFSLFLKPSPLKVWFVDQHHQKCTHEIILWMLLSQNLQLNEISRWSAHMDIWEELTMPRWISFVTAPWVRSLQYSCPDQCSDSSLEIQKQIRGVYMPIKGCTHPERQKQQFYPDSQQLHSSSLLWWESPDQQSLWALWPGSRATCSATSH